MAFTPIYLLSSGTVECRPAVVSPCASHITLHHWLGLRAGSLVLVQGQRSGPISEALLLRPEYNTMLYTLI